MSRVMSKVVSLVVLLLVLGGCAPETVATATISTTRIVVPTETVTAVAQVEATATATVTVAPAATPTMVPSRTPTIVPSRTPTIAPSQTPRPTLTPELARTSAPDQYVMPAWVSEPAVNVLLLNTGYHATLLNPETGERFDIPIEDGGPSVRWVQQEDGLYVHVGYPAAWDAPSWFVEEIHTVTGQIKRFEVPRQLTPSPPSIPSPDGRYEVRIITSDGVPAAVFLLNQESGTEVELANPFDSQYPRVIDVEWAPDGQMVAIERAYSIEDVTANQGWRNVSALVVYSADGNKLGEYLDFTGNVSEWSPTVPYRLLYPRVGMVDNPPCVIDVVTDSHTCLDQLVSWREEQNVQTTNYKWSPDGHKVGFVYWSEVSDESGFCYIDLLTGGIECPITVEDLQADVVLDQIESMCDSRTLFVLDYYWSPDLHYIALIVDPAPPLSDYRACFRAAVADSAGEQFRLIMDGWLTYHDEPWRPLVVGGSD
jgi:hypothetical protein